MTAPAVLLAIVAHWAGLPAQDPPPLPPLPASEAPAAEKLPEPGVLPVDASPEARQAWERVCRASVVPGAERKPVTAFELGLQVRYRGSPNQSNDFDAVYRFLAPGFVSIDVVNRRKLVRGPDGDWLLDRARNETLPLGVDREFAEDRRQLDETVGVARNWVALADLRALRLVTLETLAAPPPGLPVLLRKRAAELSWLRLRTPDFGLITTGAKPTPCRASIGADPVTGWVELALVEDDGAGQGPLASSQIVELRGLKPVDGFLAPQQIFVWYSVPGSSPPEFPDKAGMDLWVKRANFRARLTAAEFRRGG